MELYNAIKNDLVLLWDKIHIPVMIFIGIVVLLWAFIAIRVAIRARRIEKDYKRRREEFRRKFGIW